WLVLKGWKDAVPDHVAEAVEQGRPVRARRDRDYPVPSADALNELDAFYGRRRPEELPQPATARAVAALESAGYQLTAPSGLTGCLAAYQALNQGGSIEVANVLEQADADLTRFLAFLKDLVPSEGLDHAREGEVLKHLEKLGVRTQFGPALQAYVQLDTPPGDFELQAELPLGRVQRLDQVDLQEVERLAGEARTVRERLGERAEKAWTWVRQAPADKPVELRLRAADLALRLGSDTLELDPARLDRAERTVAELKDPAAAGWLIQRGVEPREGWGELYGQLQKHFKDPELAARALVAVEQPERLQHLEALLSQPGDRKATLEAFEELVRAGRPKDAAVLAESAPAAGGVAAAMELYRKDPNLTPDRVRTAVSLSLTEPGTRPADFLAPLEPDRQQALERSAPRASGNWETTTGPDGQPALASRLFIGASTEQELTFPAMALGERPHLSLKARCDLRHDKNAVLVQAREEGTEEWRTVLKLTGSSEWDDHDADLALYQGKRVELRVKLDLKAWQGDPGLALALADLTLRDAAGPLFRQGGLRLAGRDPREVAVLARLLADLPPERASTVLGWVGTSPSEECLKAAHETLRLGVPEVWPLVAADPGPWVERVDRLQVAVALGEPEKAYPALAGLQKDQLEAAGTLARRRPDLTATGVWERTAGPVWSNQLFIGAPMEHHRTTPR
ncbi:MAG: hypothetical protein AB1758_33785, partial [Candidatus Eremiobacterota bacterium]